MSNPNIVNEILGTLAEGDFTAVQITKRLNDRYTKKQIQHALYNKMTDFVKNYTINRQRPIWSLKAGTSFIKDNSDAFDETFDQEHELLVPFDFIKNNNINDTNDYLYVRTTTEITANDNGYKR